MPTTTVVIDPAGGGDYTTFAGAWTALSGSSDDLVWRFKSGGDLGALGITTNTPASLTLEPFDNSHRHNGVSGGAFTTGNITGPTAGTFPLRVTGLRSSGTVALTVSGCNVTVDACLFTVAQGITAATGRTIAYTLRNNVYLASLTLTTSGTGVHNSIVQNCVMKRDHASSGALTFSNGAGTMNLTVENNYAYNIGVGPAFSLTSGGTFNAVLSNCASHDGTADDFGGSGNLVSLAAADCFVDPTNGDFRLKSGSPLIDAGATIGAVTTDAVGTTRPQGAAYDIGAFERSAAVILANRSTLLGVGP